MSVKYIPVTWNRNKVLYDLVAIAAIALYIWVYLSLAPGFQSVTRPIDGAVLRAQAFGSCAFMLLTFILCIGPLARLDRRFLPLLYNRRHLGVMACAVAAVHLSYVLGWYYAFSPTERWAALLSANTSFGQLLGFPFEIFGGLAFIILLVMAVTSHDFWLSFLTPPLWKALHMGVYVAYVALVLHVGVGRLQADQAGVATALLLLSVAAVAGLHFAAALKERRAARVLAAPARAASDEGWIKVARPADFEDGRAKIIEVPGGLSGAPDGAKRIAVFRHGQKLSAISNACAHQNGPLGEGRIIDGCVTCPWHGFQYDPETGCAPAPFTEKIATFNLRLKDGVVEVHAAPNPAGTRTEPIFLSSPTPEPTADEVTS